MLDAILHALREAVQVTASDQENDQVSDQVRRLLQCLEAGPRSAAALMAELDLRHRPNFRKNYLNPALKAGLIERTHPEAPRARNQRYGLSKNRV